MSRLNRLSILGLAVLMAAASSARAQDQYIGYVYPAGGQQGSTFPIRLSGQGLVYASDVVVSGEGVSVRLVDYYSVMNNQEMSLLREQMDELRKKETALGDVMAAKMAWFEFPAVIRPPEVQGLICPVCSRLNPLVATVCESCGAKLEKPKDPQPAETAVKDEPPESEKELAKQNLVERIQRIFAEDERDPAVRAHTELVFAEVTVAPDAKPGRREIRVITKLGVSNALPFYVGQVPEVARRPMKTAQKPVLGKEHLAQRQRLPEE